MPKLHPIQNAFTAGEISPRMLGRSETDIYQTGLSTCHNMVVDARGPVRSRSGTRFGFEYPTVCSRLETFQVQRNVYFNMLFADGTLDILSATGTVPSQNLLLNPFFNNSAEGWTLDASGGGSSADAESGLVVLVGGSNPSAYASVARSVDLLNGELAHTLVVTTLGSGQYEVRVGTAQGLNDILSEQSTLGRYETVYIPGIVGATTVWIEVRALSQQLVSVTSIHTYTDGTGIKFITVWDCEAIDDLHFVTAPGGNAVYILHRSQPPYKLVFDEATATVSLELVVFISPPVDWVAGDYPGTGTIFQGRLWLMSTHTKSETMWGSASGTYEDFTVADPLNIVASDAILDISLESFGAISWAIGTKELVVGTANGEYIISSFQGVLSPLDIQLKRQSAYGSASIQAKQVNDQVMYVSADKRKIRAMRYVDSEDNWASQDILFLAEHLSQSRIVKFAWAPNPDNLLWATLNSGDMIACTYERNNSIAAWHRHSTAGAFSGVSVGEIAGLSIINVLAQRREGFISLEIMLEPRAAPAIDAFVRQFSPDTPFAVVTGLDHLEGMTVQVLADGAVHPERIVAGGEITLQRSYLEVFVGLGFDTEIVTLPFDKGAQTGSGASHMKRFNKIFARVLDSANPIINGDRPPSRSPTTPMNTVQPSRTTDVQVANLGWDRQALITVKQDLPLHLTLVGLFGELGQETL